ncbi:MAG: hypothetical protein PHS54_02890 [Clostridia bacterium]|nr:hypothetical protein [Clostridia bacterium]
MWTFKEGQWVYWNGTIEADRFIGDGSGLTGISGGSGTPGGADTNIQFNDGGSFGGDGNFTFNKSTGYLNLTGSGRALQEGDIPYDISYMNGKILGEIINNNNNNKYNDVGLFSCASGAGVYGYSYSGYGVYGYSYSGYGVYGYSYSETGISGSSSSGDGVFGYSSSGAGVFGYSSSGDGVFGYSSSGAGVYGESEESYSGYFSGGLGVYIGGNLKLTGSISSETGAIQLKPANNYVNISSSAICINLIAGEACSGARAVRASRTEDNTFLLAGITDGTAGRDQVIGITAISETNHYEDGDIVPVVVSGITKVYVENTTTRGDWIQASATTSGALVSSSVPPVPADANHWRECGHILESGASGALVNAVIHLN